MSRGLSWGQRSVSTRTEGPTQKGLLLLERAAPASLPPDLKTSRETNSGSPPEGWGSCKSNGGSWRLPCVCRVLF